MKKKQILSHVKRDEVAKSIGYFIVFITILTLFKYMVFYSLFSIKIGTYIKWEELFVLAFEDLYILIPIFLTLGLAVNTLLIKYFGVDKDGNINYELLLSIFKGLFIACIGLAVLWLLLNYIFNVPLFVLPILRLNYSKSNEVGLFIITLIVATILSWAYYFCLLKIMKYLKAYLPESDFNLFFNSFTFVAISIIVTVINITALYSQVFYGRRFGSQFQTEKDVFNVNDDSLLIGRTQDYTFILDVKNNSNIIISNEQIIKSVIVLDSKRPSTILSR